jgi:hypothetical protein
MPEPWKTQNRVTGRAVLSRPTSKCQERFVVMHIEVTRPSRIVASFEEAEFMIVSASVLGPHYDVLR